ncbi:hypothetical protein [Zavarzinella formosa]|uniref:hypothetical protein n=1 Tax=Zavarzinella formosa TaxID=360055 RepID=UPI0002E713F4|nr:hypothetical protein [Zavarzinella formosa]
MYHVYEQAGSYDAGHLLILSDDQWKRLTVQQQGHYRLLAGGFRTGLEAVVRLVKLTAIKNVTGELRSVA